MTRAQTVAAFACGRETPADLDAVRDDLAGVCTQALALAHALGDGTVYHTYSAYARGLDGLWGMYQWLDRAPRGRNEARGPGDPLNWFRRHDEYHDANGASR
jgi:predicted dithiol-disulfide oxidoreductase (DUF899 family)